MRRSQEIEKISPKVKEYFSLGGAVSWWKPEGLFRYDNQRKFIDRYINIKNKTVLDVATGTGRFAIHYAKNKAKDVIALDISKQMLEIAKKNAMEQNTLDKIHFVHADIENYKSDISFDIINCMEVFVHFPNPQKVMNNLSQMLCRGGGGLDR